YWLSSKPIEDWLNKGPFGEDSYEAAPHLQEPETAFYYLLSLFANIRISIDHNPEFVPNYPLDFRDTVPFDVRKANTRIRIESSLGGLLNVMEGIDVGAFLALKRTETFHDISRINAYEKNTLTPVKDFVHRLLPNALEIFVNTPPFYMSEPLNNLPAVSHQWYVRAQLSLRDGPRTWVFPAPPPKDPTP
ncbi:hypothetical protein IV02_30595, partial [Pseudomonas syringae]